MAPVPLSVVVVARPGEDVQATINALSGESAHAEVVVVREWAGSGGRAPAPAVSGALEVAVLDEALPGEAVAANTGLAGARGGLVLFLRAGDLPGPGLLQGHREAHEEIGRPAIVIGGLKGDLAARAWVGGWPAQVPMRPVRHFSAPRAVLEQQEGFDPRIGGIEAAAADLLDRAAVAGVPLVERRALEVQAGIASAPRTAAREAGRGAGRMGTIAAARGSEFASAGGRAGLALRYAWPLLRAPAERGRTLGLRAEFARGRGLPQPDPRPAARFGLQGTLWDGRRPTVSVIVPFAGGQDAANAIASQLLAIERREGDELILVDNSRRAVKPPAGVRVVRADGEWSSYHARNAGAAAARGEWLLFVDADCRPAPWILDAFFAQAPAQDCGALAGWILPPRKPRGLVQRYSEWAEVLAQDILLAQPYLPAAMTACLLVRAAALADVGGFSEGVRSGGDVDLSWRLQKAGWKLQACPHAAVEHDHRESVRKLLRQHARYGAGIGWLGRRHPGSNAHMIFNDPRALRGIAADLAAGRVEWAFMRAVREVTQLAARAGRVLSNRPERPRRGRPAAALLAGTFPDRDDPPSPEDTAQAAAGRLLVEAQSRPLRFAPGFPKTAISYMEDDTKLDRVRATLRLLAVPAAAPGVLVALLRGRAARTRMLAEAPGALRLRAAGVRSVRQETGIEPRRSAGLLRGR